MIDKLNKADLKEFLDSKVVQYNNPKFIESDPIQIPHLFNKKEDIEISAFLTATIAWGNRKSIISNAKRMMQLLDHAPSEFILNHQETDLEALSRRNQMEKASEEAQFLNDQMSKIPLKIYIG